MIDTAMITLLISFLESLRRQGRAVNTISSYRSDICLFFNYLRQHTIKLDDVTPQIFQHYANHLETTFKEGPNTIRRMTVSVRRFYQFLQAENKIDSNTVKYVKVPKRIETLPDVFNEDVFSRMFDSIHGNSLKSKRDRAILHLLGHAGLRVSELCNLQPPDLFLAKKNSHVRVNGRYSRAIPIDATCAKSLHNYWKSLNMPDAERVFISFRGNRRHEHGGQISRHGVKHMIHELGRQNDVRCISPQTFRHYATLRWIKNGIEVAQIADYLGHNNSDAIRKLTPLLRSSSCDS